MIELLTFISYLLQLYIYILIAAAVLSWLVVFNGEQPKSDRGGDRRVSLQDH
jgi:hypothetical protein